MIAGRQEVASALAIDKISTLQKIGEKRKSHLKCPTAAPWRAFVPDRGRQSLQQEECDENSVAVLGAATKRRRNVGLECDTKRSSCVGDR